MENNLYENDFYSWTILQTKLLESKQFNRLDLENMIEEFRDLGSNKKDAFMSQIIRVLQHLLKWQYQNEMRSRSWKKSIDNGRIDAIWILDNNLGLKQHIHDIFENSFKYALRKAIKETDLSPEVFPKECPWSFEVIMNDTFYPEKDGEKC